MREKLQGTQSVGECRGLKCGARLPGTSELGQLFWSRAAPQTAWFGGRLTCVTFSPLPDPLLPLMLSTGTWEEASDYFIAEFRATSGTVLSRMPLRRVSLCFD